jgi:hypothetical protein
MQPRTFRNFQPNDHIRTKKGEVFEITERLTVFCKGCTCNTPCTKFQENTMLTIKSQRGIWEMSLKEINTKFVNNEIDEVTYKNGQWK